MVKGCHEVIYQQARQLLWHENLYHYLYQSFAGLPCMIIHTAATPPASGAPRASCGKRHLGKYQISWSPPRFARMSHPKWPALTPAPRSTCYLRATTGTNSCRRCRTGWESGSRSMASKSKFVWKAPWTFTMAAMLQWIPPRIDPCRDNELRIMALRYLEMLSPFSLIGISSLTKPPRPANSRWRLSSLIITTPPCVEMFKDLQVL